jgi:hypothetical protein
VSTPGPGEYLHADELAARTPWSVEAISRMVSRGVLRRGVHFFQPFGRRSQRVFKWSAIAALIERPEAVSTSSNHPPSHRVLDIEAATAALQGQLGARNPDERDT